MKIRVEFVGTRIEGEIYKNVDQPDGISVYYIKSGGKMYAAQDDGGWPIAPFSNDVVFEIVR